MDKGLQQAFDEHRAALLAYINKRLSDPATAEDILQDIYVKLKSQMQTTPVAYPKAYLYRMANNAVVDFIRRQDKVVYWAPQDTPSPPEQRDPSRHLDHAQQLKIVTQAMGELPQKTKDVVQLQRLKGMNKAEVADQLGISVNMVEKHLRRALHYCRDKLFKANE